MRFDVCHVPYRREEEIQFRYEEDLSRAVERCRTSEVACESTTARALHKVLLQEYQRLTA